MNAPLNPIRFLSQINTIKYVGEQRGIFGQIGMFKLAGFDHTDFLHYAFGWSIDFCCERV